jgi:hypothetical protein
VLCDNWIRSEGSFATLRRCSTQLHLSRVDVLPTIRLGSNRSVQTSGGSALDSFRSVLYCGWWLADQTGPSRDNGLRNCAWHSRPDGAAHASSRLPEAFHPRNRECAPPPTSSALAQLGRTLDPGWRSEIPDIALQIRDPAHVRGCFVHNETRTWTPQVQDQFRPKGESNQIEKCRPDASHSAAGTLRTANNTC